MKKITIAIPTLNEEKFLRKCLESIKESIEHFEGDVETLIIDSKSEDRTAEIAKESDIVERVIETEKGILKARHQGFVEAEGDIVISVDADTVYVEDFIQKLIEPFKNSEVVMTYGKALGKNNPIYGMGKSVLQYSLPLIGLDWVSGSNRAIRKESYFGQGGYNLEKDSNSLIKVILEEQFLFPQRMREHGEVVFVPEAVCYQSPRTGHSLFLMEDKEGGRNWKILEKTNVFNKTK